MEDDDRGQGLGENLPDWPAVVGDEDEDVFSFPVPALDTSACIVPVYPVFGRPASPRKLAGEEEEEPETATLRVPLGRLLLEEREFRARLRHTEEDDEDDDGEATAGPDEELEGVPPESYCLWAPGGGGQPSPSPRRCRKSGSTGSVLRWRRISDRLVGRSHSDGKDKFVFLNTPPAAASPSPSPGPGSYRDSEQEGGSRGDAAHAGRQLRYYSRGGGGAGGSGRRRSYLPYKQELVGLFANVSGLRRSYHPF